MAAPTFGLMGSIVATPGDGPALTDILERAATVVRLLPGSWLYLLAEASDDTIWVIELWDDEASHAASLKSPEVLRLITEARPIIASMDVSIRFEPRGFLGVEVEP